MCRYAFKTYKSHFACFNCRKAFKQTPSSDLLKKAGKEELYRKLRKKSAGTGNLTEKEEGLLSALTNKYIDREIKCPECGGYMADLGLDFKSPRKTAIKQWNILERLYTIGKSFYSCGCNGPGYIPVNPADYKLYLENVLKEYADSVSYYQGPAGKEYKDRKERIIYWSEKVKNIKEELKKQKVLI